MYSGGTVGIPFDVAVGLTEGVAVAYGVMVAQGAGVYVAYGETVPAGPVVGRTTASEVSAYIR